MFFQAKEIVLKNGSLATLRMAVREDACRVIELMRMTAGETHHILRYADEVTMTEEDEIGFLNATNQNPSSVFMVAEIDGELVGSCGIQPVGTQDKLCHRGSFGIAILKKYWNQGLGKAMTEFCLALCEKTPFTQIELGVFDDNAAAQALYQKAGFTPWGTQPRAFCLRDGSYHDEILMLKILK